MTVLYTPQRMTPEQDRERKARAARTERFRGAALPEHRSQRQETTTASASEPEVEPAPVAMLGALIHPRFRLATFVDAPGTAMAISAAIEVVHTSASAGMFNPLVLYGGGGLGKTHLAHAMVAEVRGWGGGAVYLPATAPWPQFDGAVLDALNLVVIDDLGEAQQHHGASVERLILRCLDAGVQLAITADRPPQFFERFGPRLRARLIAGLPVEILPLDEAGRRTLLAQAVHAARDRAPGFDVPDDVISRLASCNGTGRDLEALVNRLFAVHQLGHEAVSLSVAERLLVELAPGGVRQPTVNEIQRAAAREFGVSLNDLLSPRRTAVVTEARQIAMYIAKTLTTRSLPDIGRRFGGRDHTTVLHAVNKIGGKIPKDERIATIVDRLIQHLQGTA